MTPQKTHDETANDPKRSRARAKSLSVGDLRIHNKDAFVPDMPIFLEETPDNPEGRLIIVANRLPVTVKRNDEGVYDFVPSSGGLATGLAGVMRKTDLIWWGWPGLEVPGKDIATIKQRCQEDFKCQPVFMSEEISERHYNGFSNEILWPLFHYHPDGVFFDEYNWNGYYEANRIFAQAIAPTLRDEDIVWVQDYHLMLLPEMLRQELSKLEMEPMDVRIGFFLHTPFPSSEIFRILPVREKILEGVLACDLIGFHTPDYARHFINSCSRVLDLATTPTGVYYKDRIVEVRDCPIGIDPIKFHDAMSDPEVVKRCKALQRRFEGVKVIVGVDRLDYIKGVQQKLHAFEVFLTEHPEWIGKVVLVQVAVPSRGEVEEYKNLRTHVNELVGRINGRFGTIESAPIHFMHASVSFKELVALYSISDVCLVTSTRDGMNLVSYEYVACQEERNGVLVLSEFTGAAQSLNGALIINPWDAEMVANAVHEAVTMPDAQRLENYEKLARIVNKKTSENWGTTFVCDIAKTAEIANFKLDLHSKGASEDSDCGSVQHDLTSREETCSRGNSAVDSRFTSDGGSAEDSDAELRDEEEDEGLMLRTTSKSPPTTD